VDQAVNDVSDIIGERRACARFDLPRGSFQRRIIRQAVQTMLSSTDIDPSLICETIAPRFSRQVQRYLARRERKSHRAAPQRSLTESERQDVLDAVHQARFVDRSVPYIYATLLDENHYYGSISTIYRVLRSVDEVGDRRNQAAHPAHVKPELCATAPNQVYAWDITKLHGPEKWTYFHLYVVIDIYSRYIVGWMIADRESSKLAKILLRTTIKEQGADPKQLTIHSDRGSSMKSKPVAFMLADLGVTKSHSRPHVSNDNPHIESFFKTTKYQPAFPATFANIIAARAFCRDFINWYNRDHRHSAIALLTPSDVHHGRVDERTAARHAVLSNAYGTHPERFVNGAPKPLQLKPSYINRPEEISEALASAA
jgi:putative transposase